MKDHSSPALRSGHLGRFLHWRAPMFNVSNRADRWWPMVFRTQPIRAALQPSPNRCIFARQRYHGATTESEEDQ
jgi:hypothetical protein